MTTTETFDETMDARAHIELANQLGAHNYKPLDVVLTRGEGVWVWDVDGNKYLDCLSAYSALNQGHSHPRLVEAMVEQAQRLALTSRAFRNDQLGLFYRDLVELSGYGAVLPMNTGAEAVETALKVARKWAYTVKGVPVNQAEIITASGNFHGRTVTVISFSTEPQYKDLFGPHTPGFLTVPYGDADALAAAITPNTAAIMLEPIQGEAGVVVPPEGYLRRVRELCDEHNVLFIADEIQTGLGRTGELFACDHEGVRPDIMVLGKALGGGMYPVSAVLSSREIMDVIVPGDHGSTFGGNPLAAVVARTALDIIVEEKLIENAAEMGQYFRDHLEEINSPHVDHIRGKGLLIGVVLKPEANGARRFCEALMERGILAKETHENVIRFAPPLIIDRETIDWAMPIIRDVLLMP
ncbi:MAG TPA: ornithine--oxo-acid transaminase [Aggregatilineales bacterium]|nr:ornithine--oxo-acid transaminase [Aggregatilineales bacterium]